MSRYEPGDYVKVEFADEASGESEWMWVEVHSCDDEKRLLFGQLDSVPVVHSTKLQLGARIAVSYDKIRDHRKPHEFTRQ